MKQPMLATSATQPLDRCIKTQYLIVGWPGLAFKKSIEESKRLHAGESIDSHQLLAHIEALSRLIGPLPELLRGYFMGYRAILETTPETVQDLELSASRRLEEAIDMLFAKRNHAAIYIAGLSAEMYLKTACFFLGGAVPADRTDALMAAVRPGRYNAPFRADYESGHGLWFWSQELIARRNRRQLGRVPNRFLQIVAALYVDWYISMRYRPGVATQEQAVEFVSRVEWLANNHALLRR